jgi:SP family arabinose:H+ symporter-like MFS transporter
MVLTALSQFSGIKRCYILRAHDLKIRGNSSSDALLYQVMLGTASMLFTFIAVWKVDSLGRRPLYIDGFDLRGTSPKPDCLLFFIRKYTDGPCGLHYAVPAVFPPFRWDQLKFVIATEIFPTHVRGTAVSVCIMTMWVADWLVNLLFPDTARWVGYRGYIFYFRLLLPGVLILCEGEFILRPRVKSLEEISVLEGAMHF